LAWELLKIHAKGGVMSKVSYERTDLLRYANLFLASEDKLNARRIYRYLLQQNPHDREAQEGMQKAAKKRTATTSNAIPLSLDCYLKGPKIDLSFSEIVKALKGNELSPSERGYLLVSAGVLHFRANNHLQARHQFEAAIELDDKNYRARTGLGMVHWRRERYHDSWIEFMSSLDINPTHLPALLGLLRVAQTIGRLSLARCYLRRYLAEQPDNMELWVLLAKVDLVSGHPNEASKVLRRVLRQDSEHGEARELLRELSTS